jgi:3-oxoacyl-[acyl-carrier protein] reductase
MTIRRQTAIVSGSAQGIGLAIAMRLSQDGAAIGVADINQSAADQAVGAIVSAGGRALAVAMDAGDNASVATAVQRVAELLGPPTILINNAGIYPRGPIMQLDIDQWQSTLAVNLSGAFFAARAVFPYMVAAKWGRIVNMSSMMAAIAFGDDAAYCSSKAGLLGLTRSLAAEFGPHNICVNAICPGNIVTPMMDEVAASVERRDGLEQGSFLKNRAQVIPLRRLGLPEDIAKMTSFLCSADADYVTGQALHVNGGLYFH